jgi:succinate dehydrogenase cytochrome b556 subunit
MGIACVFQALGSVGFMADVRDALLVGRTSDGKLVRRPLSPHLQVYKPQITTITSILHRISGVALGVGTLVLTWWLVAAATSDAAYGRAAWFISSWIGILMLMGIVTKNAILLVDFAIEMQARGMNRFDAMVEAGRKRARPIVMTSIAMSAGMLPSALGVGEGGSFRAPMATAVIGGIIMSTVLSLVIVPSFFLIMDDVGRLLSWAFGRFVGKKDEEPEPVDPAILAASLEAAQSDIAALRTRVGRIEDGAAPLVPRHAAE